MNIRRSTSDEERPSLRRAALLRQPFEVEHLADRYAPESKQVFVQVIL